MGSSPEFGSEPRPEGPEAYESEKEPETQPAGSLVPPPSKPPTAMGADAEPPPFNPRRFREAWRQRGWRKSWLAETVNQILDSADGLADQIRAQLGLK
jgi:hypothetical protein